MARATAASFAALALPLKLLQLLHPSTGLRPTCSGLGCSALVGWGPNAITTAAASAATMHRGDILCPAEATLEKRTEVSILLAPKPLIYRLRPDITTSGREGLVAQFDIRKSRALFSETTGMNDSRTALRLLLCAVLVAFTLAACARQDKGTSGGSSAAPATGLTEPAVVALRDAKIVPPHQVLTQPKLPPMERPPPPRSGN